MQRLNLVKALPLTHHTVVRPARHCALGSDLRVTLPRSGQTRGTACPSRWNEHLYLGPWSTEQQGEGISRRLGRAARLLCLDLTSAEKSGEAVTVVTITPCLLTGVQMV